MTPEQKTWRRRLQGRCRGRMNLKFKHGIIRRDGSFTSLSLGNACRMKAESLIGARHLSKGIRRINISWMRYYYTQMRWLP